VTATFLRKGHVMPKLRYHPATGDPLELEATVIESTLPPSSKPRAVGTLPRARIRIPRRDLPDLPQRGEAVDLPLRGALTMEILTAEPDGDGVILTLRADPRRLRQCQVGPARFLTIRPPIIA